MMKLKLHKTPHGPALRAAGLCLLAAAAAAPLAGCRGDRTDKPPRRFFPDMDDQQKWDPQEQTTFFADGRTARQPVEGTVPFGRTPKDPALLEGSGWGESYLAERVSLLGESDAVFRGVSDSGDGYIDYIPIPVTLDLVERGQERFNIYCAACHGYAGDGQGMVGKVWSYAPANITTGIYVDRTDPKGSDGYLFHVVREGVWGVDGANRMPGYKHAVSEEDAWAIVSYIRALQTSISAPASILTPTERESLERGRGASAPAPAPAPVPAPATDGGTEESAGSAGEGGQS